MERRRCGGGGSLGNFVIQGKQTGPSVLTSRLLCREREGKGLRRYFRGGSGWLHGPLRFAPGWDHSFGHGSVALPDFRTEEVHLNERWHGEMEMEGIL